MSGNCKETHFLHRHQDDFCDAPLALILRFLKKYFTTS